MKIKLQAYLASTILLIPFFIAGCCSSTISTLTQKDLTENSKIPEKRSFHESTKISPCEDFHEYVCKDEEDQFQLPKDRSSWYFSFNDNSEKILNSRKNFFKKISQGYFPDGVRIQQVRNFYLACMDTESSKSSEINYINKKKNKISQFKSKNDFQSWIGETLGTGDSAALDFDVIPNNSNPNQNDILIIPILTTLPEPTYYKNKQALQDLAKIAEELFITLNINDPKKRAEQVVLFEKELAQQMPLPAEFRDLMAADTYKTKDYFKRKYHHLNLSKFLNSIPQNTNIRDLTPKAMTFLDNQLASANIETLQSVFLFSTLKNVLDDSFPKYRNLLTDFEHKYLRGPQKRPERQERCTQFVSSAFAFEVDEYLSPILFPNFSEQKIIDLVDRVRESIISKIKSNTWLSEGAKKEALQKIETAKLFLVKPKNEKEWNFNPVQEYSKIDSIDNIIRLGTALKEKTISELLTPRVRQKWDYSPLTLNAYYSPSDNKFVLLQGILQYPFYDPRLSDIENIAAIGSVIGHELGHAIDDNGSRYDSTGAVRQWMTEADLKEFRKRGQGFITRFEKVGHNGKLTLGENIGDHVGINSSYRAAFSKNPAATIEDKRNFFKAYARMWCNKSTPEFDQNQIKTDPHSLGKERINQQVLHVDGFHEAFSCKPGNKMYLPPEDRIQIW